MSVLSFRLSVAGRTVKAVGKIKFTPHVVSYVFRVSIAFLAAILVLLGSPGAAH